MPGADVMTLLLVAGATLVTAVVTGARPRARRLRAAMRPGVLAGVVLVLLGVVLPAGAIARTSCSYALRRRTP